MLRSSRLWFVAGPLFVVANFAGAGWAVMEGEMMHATVHVVLLLAGLLAMSRIAPRREVATAQLDALTDNRLAHLERSVDAVAEEVERVGDAQRFMTGLFAQRRTAPPDQGGVAPSPGSGPAADEPGA